MNESSVKQALAKAFLDQAFLPAAAVAFPNVQFEPPSAAPWAQWAFISAETEVGSLGIGGMDEFTGYVRVSLHYPLNTGDFDIHAKADQLCRYFCAGQRFRHEDTEVILQRTASRGPAYRDPNFNTYRLDVFIYFFSRLVRQVTT